MAAYTTTTLLGYLMPSPLPSDVTAGMQAQWIADASAYVDGMVGKRYPMLGDGQKFADITDSPATPALIELCARWVAAHYGWLKLGEINRTEATNATKYLEMADDKLKAIREGEADIYSAAGADLATAETAYSTTEDRDPTFTRGARVDGELQGDAGTLDDFSLN